MHVKHFLWQHFLGMHNEINVISQLQQVAPQRAQGAWP